MWLCRCRLRGRRVGPSLGLRRRGGWDFCCCIINAGSCSTGSRIPSSTHSKCREGVNEVFGRISERETYSLPESCGRDSVLLPSLTRSSEPGEKVALNVGSGWGEPWRRWRRPCVRSPLMPVELARASPVPCLIRVSRSRNVGSSK